MNRIIDAIVFLTRQGLDIRGDNENEDSCNRRNFLELLTLLSSVDADFGQQFLTLPSNDKFTSPDIRNELIGIAACEIGENICREAAGASLIATIVDDSKDITRKEQMSLCIRHTLSTSKVHAEFLMPKHMTNVDAKSLF